MTFNFVILNPVLKMPLLVAAIQKFEAMRDNPEELAKTGLTPSEYNDRLRKLRSDLGRFQGTNRNFQNKYQAKVCGLASKDSR
jgi:hypothetical protein